jgi:hypothetical protein
MAREIAETPSRFLFTMNFINTKTLTQLKEDTIINSFESTDKELNDFLLILKCNGFDL